MSAVFEFVNEAALVLGYFVLTIWLIFVIWVANVLIREVRHDLKRKRHEQMEWDNIRSRWLLDMKNDERYTVHSDTHSTDVLDFSIEDVYDYQKELGNDYA